MRTFRRPELYAAFSAPVLRRCRAAALCCVCTAAAGQTTTTGTLQGTLSPSAREQTFVLRNPDTQSTLFMRPRPDGTFLLPALAPGDYILTGPGLAPTAVSIHAGETTTYPPPEAFATQTPQTVQPDQDDDGLLSAQALPSTQNTQLVDGLETTQFFHATPAGTGAEEAPDPEADSDSADLTTGPAHGLSRGRHAGAAYAFSSASIREFRIDTNGASAATAGTPATLSMVTRAGSPRFHGSGLFTLRSQAFAATNPLSLATTYADGVATTTAVKPHDLRENLAATLGGRIPHTAVYFLYVFDAQRRGFPAVSSPANPAFYTLTAIQRALLATRGVSSAATQSALNYLASLTGATPRRSDQTIDFLRLDGRARTQDLSLEYNRLRWNHPAGLAEAPVVAAARNSLGNSNGSVDNLVLRLTSTFTARRVNQLRFQVSRDLQFESPQTPLPQEPAIGPGGLAPEVVIGPNGFRFGTPADLSRQAYPDERRLDLSDSLSLVVGRHLVEAGAGLSAVDDRVSTLANSAGTFRYDSTRTVANAGGLVDFITDQTFNVHAYPNGACPSITAPIHLFCFSSFSQSFGQARVTFPTQAYAAYVQDTWHIRRTLVLQAGLRYEYLLLPFPAQPNPALDSIFSTRGATSIFPEDRNNLGPHASLTAEPFGTGRLTVSLAYSTFFGRLPGATLAAALDGTALPSSTLHVRLTPATVTACPQAMGQGFGYPCSFTAMPVGTAATTASATVFDRRFRLPDIQQATVRVSRVLGIHTELSASYLLNLDRQLPSSTDLNIAPSTARSTLQLQGGPHPGEVFAVPLYTARITPSYGPVTAIVSNVNATYNALLLTIHTRIRKFLAADAQYTWSKALDTGVALSGTPRTDAQFDPFTNGYDKARSSLNSPQTFRIAASASSPHTGHLLLSGWEASPVLLGRSGRPYSDEIFGGSRLSGGHLSINGSGGALYLPTIGRNTLLLPYALRTDLRVARTFSLHLHVAGEPVSLRMAADIFNLTNRVNLSSVESRAYLVGTPAGGVTPLVFQDASAIAAEGLTTQPFGTPTAAASSLQRERQIQLSLRIAF